MNLQVVSQKTFLSDLVSQCRKLGKAKRETCAYGLKDVRDAAAESVLSASFPTTKDEEWRFTDLSPLLEIPFQVAESNSGSTLKLSDITLPVSSKDDLPLRVVFVNGVYAPHLSTVEASILPTVALEFYAGNLSHAPGNYHARIRQYLSQKQQFPEVFSALNATGLVDASIVVVPRNQAIETPIHLLFIATGETPTLTLPHCLIFAEPGSRVTLVEDYASLGNTPTLTSAVTEIVVGENATVDHIRLQREGTQAFHIGKSLVTQHRNSHYAGHAVSLGAKISRHNLEILQQGEGTETLLNGLTILRGEQLGDTHSKIIFNAPQGTSRQLHKCIVDDKAHAVFNGKVFVPKIAQLTDAGQLNRNLLLSQKARVDTKPELEIVADNVKCSHGATVSQLEDDEVFYLQSRGLNEETSRRLLIDAFAAEVLNQLPVGPVRQMLTRAVAVKT